MDRHHSIYTSVDDGPGPAHIAHRIPCSLPPLQGTSLLRDHPRPGLPRAGAAARGRGGGVAMMIIMAARIAEQRFSRRIAMGNFLRSKKSRHLPAIPPRDALHTPPSLPRASRAGCRGGGAPAGGTACPLFWKTLESGPGGITADAPIGPLPSLPQAGCRGRSPRPGGTGGVPLYPKTSEGGAGGIAAQAKPDPPLNQGAGRNKTLRPGSVLPLLQNANYCAMVSP